jgi:hypothetical protein
MMEDEDDTVTGGEELSISQAAAAYAKATATKEAPTGQSEAEEDDESETTDDELQASDEEVGEEDDGEPGEEGQAEDEDEEEPGSDQGRFVASNGKVRLPDGTVSTVSELIQGNLRDRDYRQKTMEVAELRRSTETQSSSLKQLETQLSEQRDYMVSLLKSIVPQAPDIALADPRSPHYDPAAYQTQKAQNEFWVQHLTALDQQGQQAKQAQAEEAAAKRREKGNAEWATLIEKLPSLKDPKRLERFVGDVEKYGKSYGFTTDELREALGYDHRQALVMHKAMAWDKLQESKPKVKQKVEGRPPVQKGGKRLNPAEHRARGANEAINRLKQSGSVEDATAAYLASLNR